MHKYCRSRWSLRRAETWPTGSALWATWSARPRLRTACGRCLRWPPEPPCRSASARTGRAASCCEGTDCGPISSSPSPPAPSYSSSSSRSSSYRGGGDLKSLASVNHTCFTNADTPLRIVKDWHTGLKAKHISLSGKQTRKHSATYWF